MLTYCTNIHPGESWGELTRNIWPAVLATKKRVAPHSPFPVGLRISALAARQATPRQAAEFLEACSREGCFIPTLNGFPYGSFHGERVKEQAYLPDWRDPKRVGYTLDLIRLLKGWLPTFITGSISTVPVGYGGHIQRSELPLVRHNLLHVLQELERAADAGSRIILALEPEPGCLLETACDVTRFVEEINLPRRLRPFLGVCFDCCHAAVAFEEPQQAFSLLRQADIPVAKIHLSSAVTITAHHLEAAQIFDEPRYLHQTTVRRDGRTFRYGDLCHALSAPPPFAGEWRVHFHLPIFDDGNDIYGTTNGFIRDVLSCRPPDCLLEIETYTYQILPEEVPQAPITDFICREFDWLRSCL